MSKNLSTQATYILSGRIIAKFFTLLVPLIIVRIFEKDTFGDYRALLLLFFFFARFLRLGIREALIYSIGRSDEKESQHLGTANNFLLFVGLINLFLFYFFSEEISLLFDIPHL